jgi:hypothetical protein
MVHTSILKPTDLAANNQEEKDDKYNDSEQLQNKSAVSGEFPVVVEKFRLPRVDAI